MQRDGAALTSCQVVKERSRQRGFDGWETRIRTWIDGVRDRGPYRWTTSQGARHPHIPISCSSFMVLLPDHRLRSAHLSCSPTAAAEQSSGVTSHWSIQMDR